MVCLWRVNSGYCTLQPAHTIFQNGGNEVLDNRSVWEVYTDGHAADVVRAVAFGWSCGIGGWGAAMH